MRHVPMGIVTAIDILQPFLELTAGANLIGRQLVAHRDDIGPERSIHSKNLARLDDVVEQVADEGVVNRRTGGRELSGRRVIVFR